MRLFTALAAFFAVSNAVTLRNISAVENGCVSFSVSGGTGCAWMCNYCAGALGTNNYYFTDGVCTYQTSGCVGNPQAGKQYTCCAAGEDAAQAPVEFEEETTVHVKTRRTLWV